MPQYILTNTPEKMYNIPVGYKKDGPPSPGRVSGDPPDDSPYKEVSELC